MERNCYYTVRQARVYVLNLRYSDMLFALCPFYFCLTKTRMKRMHRLSHTHSEVSIADMTKNKRGHQEKANKLGKGIKLLFAAVLLNAYTRLFTC